MNLLKRIFKPQAALLDDQRVAAGIVTEVLLELEKATAPDVSLKLLDELAERIIRERGGVPTNKGYQPSWSTEPFPATICTSVNQEAVHGLPIGELKNGDIVTYDLGVRYKSGCADAALTVAVGEIDNRKARLLRYAQDTLKIGCNTVRAGISLYDLGAAMENYARMHGYSIVRDFGGHTIGREMHEQPFIPHWADPDTKDDYLKAGQVICLEPILTPGTGALAILKDGWTFKTVDNQPAAMFEVMMLVTDEGNEVLTKHLF